MVESCVEKLRKPDPRIYQRALQLLGVSAAETLFLDDLEVNVTAAEQLGINAIKVGPSAGGTDII